MAKVQIWVEMSDEHLNRLSDAAEQKGVPVERLVEQTVKKLIEENERTEHDGTDHPIVMC